MPKIVVQGMHCANCQKAVYEAVQNISGVGSVSVDLEKGEVAWEEHDSSAPADVEAIKAAIRRIGFDAP